MKRMTSIALASFAAIIVMGLQQQLVARDDCTKRIKSDLEVCGDADFKRNVTVEGNLDVVGNTSTNDLTVRRNLAVGGNSSVQALTVNTDLNVTGATAVQDLTVNGDLTVAGTTNVTNQTVTNLSVTGVITTPVTVTSGPVGPVAEVGDVLVVSSTTDGQVERSFVTNQTTVVGVAASDVAANGTVNMVLAGEFQVKVTGPVGRGNFLVTSDEAGVAQVGSGQNAFAIATSTSADAGVKLVTARYIVADTI
jgi:cytoskeletal protein CcmA (bactofilin family)